MSELTDISNIYVEDGEKEEYYDKIHLLNGMDRKDQFLVAMSVGFVNNSLKSIKKKHVLFKSKNIERERDDIALVNAVALYKTGDVEILADKVEVYKIAEEYANAGIKILKNKEDQAQIGNYLKIFEKEVIDSYKELKELESSELDQYLIHGESSKLEFKSTLRWSVKGEVLDRSLETVVAKTVAGFLNSEGGVLLIGVADDKSIYGIEKDFETLGNKNDMDGFELHLTQILENHLGKIAISYLDIGFVEKDNLTVCVVEVKPSPEPVYLKDKDNKLFYARLNNATKPLDVEETIKYINLHWKT
ncbi:ATP-binding protein [Methanobacterium sp. YSL]|nr:ATP-binding protein [Methanobacterium sp. YSL]